MNESFDQLPALEIDVDQWRREVQTFAASTRQQLAAINDQIASGFSGAESGLAVSTPPSSITPERLGKDSPSDSSPVGQCNTDRSLADIRQKLAAKLQSKQDAR